MKKLKSVVELKQFQGELLAEREGIKKSIAVCEGTGCHAYKSSAVADEFEKQIGLRGLEGQITVRRTGCHGFCERGPMAKIFPEKIFYFQVKPEDVAEIVDSTIVNDKPVERLLFLDDKTREKMRLPARDSLLPASGAGRFRKQFSDQPQEYRRLHRRGRLFGPG